jgi:hypothetical protein
MCYGAKEMSESERREFLSWYDNQKSAVAFFDNKRNLETYGQNDFTVLIKAYRVFRQELMQIGNIGVLLEAIKIAFTCIKVLRKRFLETDNKDLIPTCGYTGNVKYSKKALM